MHYDSHFAGAFSVIVSKLSHQISFDVAYIRSGSIFRDTFEDFFEPRRMLGSISFSLAALSVLTAASPVTKRSISGPILNSVNFPDPSFVISGSTWYAYSTNSGGHNVPMATSPDFQTWTLKSGYDALPTVGAWSTGKDVWAPDVVQLVSRSHVRVFTTTVLIVSSYPRI